MSKVAKEDGMEAITRLLPRQSDTEICFFVEPGGFVRLRGVADDPLMDKSVRQLTYRCGVCGQPVTEQEIKKHFDTHAKTSEKVS